MKKSYFLFISLILVSLSFTSCQKAKETEGKKEVPFQQAKKEETKQETSEVKAEVQVRAQEKASKPETTAVQNANPSEIKKSPLSEKEQKDFDKFGGGWQSSKWFKNEAQAIKYVKLLIKGDHRTIRWYQESAYKNGYGDDTAKKWYSDDIGTALSSINMKENKEGFALALDVLKTKADYPEAMAVAAKVVKFAHDKSVIPLLQEVAKHPAPSVRLEAAGTLLILGDADTALPVLDELTEKEGYSGALYYLFSGSGQMIDARGYRIVEKALNAPKAEVRITAVKLSLEAKKISKTKAEDIALGIVEEFKDKTRESYGVTVTGDNSRPKWVVLKGFEGKTVEELEKPFHSDGRACELAIFNLGHIKSKKAIPLLKYITRNNIDSDHVCWETSSGMPAATALEKIIGQGGTK